jgi:glucose-6-phosphate isomerase
MDTTLPSKNPTKSNAWNSLIALRKNYSTFFPLKDTFQKDSFVFELGELRYDFSSEFLNAEIFKNLIDLAIEMNVDNAKKKMFDGEKINTTENRAVLHVALRENKNRGLKVDETDIHQEVNEQLNRIKHFCDKFHNKEFTGITGKTLNTIVNIGIGGSDLGPDFINESLLDYNKGIKTYYLNNIDDDCFKDMLRNTNPETTLFVIVSKTFTTIETMTNAKSVVNWFAEKGLDATQAVAKQFIAVTAKPSAEEVLKFGIKPENTFYFWDWVSGRLSLWSAAGISIPLAIGYDNFEELLAGARAADEHFLAKPLAQNIPVIQALLGIWYTNFWNANVLAVLPYSHRLKKLVPFLQQMIMESNGKSASRNNERVNYSTCPVIFGGEGTNCQHSFFQLLHQGTEVIPTQFVKIAHRKDVNALHQQILNANCEAQIEALRTGSDNENQQKVYEGNRPATLISMKELTPKNLGSLIAFYEHTVFVQGVIWNIFSFDQWGVELGKKLAKKHMENF